MIKTHSGDSQLFVAVRERTHSSYEFRHLPGESIGVLRLAFDFSFKIFLQFDSGHFY